MFIHNYPIDLTDYLQQSDIVDNLISTLSNKALSANQGLVLKSLIDSKIVPVTLALVGSDLVLSMDDGSTISMDASTLLIDRNAISGTYDDTTKSIVITLNDSTYFSIPVASLLPVTTDSTIDGNGSGIPLSIPLSTDTDNQLLLGTDGKILVRYPELSTNNNNSLSLGTDNKLYLKKEDNFTLSDNEAVASQGAIKSYIGTEVDKVVKSRVFMDDTTLAPTTAGNPTLAEVLVFANNLVPQYRDGIMYYTGNDSSTDTVEKVYHIDKVGNVTLIFNIETAAPTVIVQDLSNPTTDEVLSTQGIKDITKYKAEYVHAVPKFIQSTASSSPVAVYWKPYSPATQNITHDGNYFILQSGVYALQGVLEAYSSEISNVELKLYGDPNPTYLYTKSSGKYYISVPFVYYLKVPVGSTKKVSFQVSLSGSGTKRQMSGDSIMFIQRIGDE